MRARRATRASHHFGLSVPGTPVAPRAPRAPCVTHIPAWPGAPRLGHVQSVLGAPAHVTAHIGKHVGPHHPCRRPIPIIVSGGPAHSRPYATTLAVPAKNHSTVIAGWPRMIQI
eukprot:7645718-Pyramimonas_sp.AAC.1